MGRHVVDGRAAGVEQPDPAAGAAHEARDRSADGLEHGVEIEAGGDELARSVERRQLFGATSEVFIPGIGFDLRFETLPCVFPANTTLLFEIALLDAQ